jgi:molecular chaperone GrpE
MLFCARGIGYTHSTMDDNDLKKDAVSDAPDDFVIEESDEEGNVGSPADQMKRLREKLKKAVAEKQEYLDGWQRLRADFLNYKKRTDEALEHAEEIGRSSVIEDLLSAVESFDMAMGNKEAWEKVEKNWRMGVEYIYQQLLGGLESHGLKSLSPAIGSPFDPTHHSAVETVHTDDEGKDHTVAEVVQKGYMLGDKVLRPPKVKVYSKGGL